MRYARSRGISSMHERTLIVSFVIIGALLIATHHLLAGPPDGRFIVVSGGIKDGVTGLTWQQPDDGQTYTWANAKTHCSSPWRLPTVDELFTLIDVRATSAPVIDPVFTNTGSTYYWSATPYADGSVAYAWDVDFSYGAMYQAAVSNTYRVRCVQ